MWEKKLSTVEEMFYLFQTIFIYFISARMIWTTGHLKFKRASI